MNLFDLFANDLEEQSLGLSGLMTESLATDLSRAAHKTAGVPFGKRIDLGSKEARSKLLGAIPETGTQELENLHYRRFASNVLGATGADVRRLQSRIMAGQDVTGLFQSDPALRNRTISAIAKTGIKSNDFFTALELGREGTTVRDAAQTLGRSMIYNTVLHSEKSAERGVEAFGDAAAAAMKSGLEAAYTYNPSMGRFDSYASYSMRSGIKSDKGAMKRAMNIYGSVWDQDREQVAGEILDRFGQLTNLMSEKDLAADKPITLTWDGMKITSTPSTIYERIGDTLGYLDTHPAEYRRSGFVVDDALPAIDNFRDPIPGPYNEKYDNEHMWPALTNYAKVHGGVPMSSAGPRNKAAARRWQYNPDAPKWISEEDLARAREMAKNKTLPYSTYMNFRNSFDALTAKGFSNEEGQLSSIEKWQQHEENLRDVNSSVEYAEGQRGPFPRNEIRPLGYTRLTPGERFDKQNLPAPLTPYQRTGERMRVAGEEAPLDPKDGYDSYQSFYVPSSEQTSARVAKIKVFAGDVSMQTEAAATGLITGKPGKNSFREHKPEFKKDLNFEATAKIMRSSGFQLRSLQTIPISDETIDYVPDSPHQAARAQRPPSSMRPSARVGDDPLSVSAVPSRQQRRGINLDLSLAGMQLSTQARHVGGNPTSDSLDDEYWQNLFKEGPGNQFRAPVFQVNPEFLNVEDDGWKDEYAYQGQDYASVRGGSDYESGRLSSWDYYQYGMGSGGGDEPPIDPPSAAPASPEEDPHQENMRILREATPEAIRRILQPRVAQRQMLEGPAGTGKSEIMAVNAARTRTGTANIPGDRSLAVTGTRSAAATAQNRMLKHGVGTEDSPGRGMTVHSLAMRGLKRIRGIERFGIPENFSSQNIIGPEELGGAVAKALESTGLDELQRYTASGARTEGFIKKIGDYSKGFEHAMIEGHRGFDFDNPDVASLYMDKFKVAPDIMRHVIDKIRPSMGDKMTLGMIVPTANKVIAGHEGAANAMYGNQFDTISIDEAHQMSQAEIDLVKSAVDVNPDASVQMGVDSLQAPLWKFKQGGDMDMLYASAREMGLDVTNLTDSFRHGPNMISAVGKLLGRDLGVVSALDDSPGDASKAVDLHVGLTPHDAIKSAVTQAAELVQSGVDPREVIMQTFTNKTAGEIADYGNSQGFGGRNDLFWRKKSDAHWQAKGIYENWSQERIDQEKAADLPRTNQIPVGTIHEMEGREAQHSMLVTMPGEYSDAPGRADESMSRLYTAMTRASGVDGQFHVHSAGRIPAQLEPLGGTVTATQRAAERLAYEGRHDPSVIDFEKEEHRKKFAGSFKVRPEDASALGEENTAAVESFMNSATDKAIEELSQPNEYNVSARHLSKKAIEHAAKIMTKAIDSVGEAAAGTESDTPASRASIANVRKAIAGAVSDSYKSHGVNPADDIVEGVRGTVQSATFGPGSDYTNRIYSKSKAAPPAPPGGGGPPGPPDDGGGGGFLSGLFGGGDGKGFEWYKAARGMWAARMAGNALTQAFTKPLGQAAQYGQYMSGFLPFAAMEGDVSASPQYYAIQQMQAQRAMQQGAYEQWGPMTGFFARQAQAGDSGWMPRMAAAGSTGINIAGGMGQAAIMAKLMGPMMGMSAAGASALAGGLFVGGAAIAGTTLALAGGIEAYNQWWKPDDEHPMSIGKLFFDQPRKDTAIDANLPAARDEYMRRHGLSSEEFDELIQTQGSYIPGRGVPGSTTNQFDELLEPGKTQLGNTWFWDGWFGGEETRRGAAPDEIRDIAWEMVKESDPGLYYTFQKREGLATTAMEIAGSIADKLGETEEATTGPLLTMVRDMPNITDENFRSMADQIAEQAGRAGLGFGQFYQDMVNQARSTGLTPHGDQWEQFVQGSLDLDLSPTERFLATEQMTHLGGRQSQLGQYFSTPTQGIGFANSFGMTSQAQISSAASAGATIQASGLSDDDLQLAMGLISKETPFRGQMINRIAQEWGSTGLSPMDVYTGLAGADMSTQDLDFMARIMTSANPTQAISAASRYGALDGAFGPGMQFYNMHGELTGTRSGMDFIRYSQDRGRGPLNYVEGSNFNANPWSSGPIGSITGAQWFQGFFGHDNMDPGYYEAWAEGGSRGAGKFVESQVRGLQMAGIGIQMQQLNAQRAHLWGGGSWDNPDPGSMWGLQDQLSALQHRSQMATFGYQEKMSSLNWGYTQKQMGMQEERMGISHDYQRWMSSFNRDMSVQQREWTQQDWGYADTMSSLGFEWNMEDFDEQIRMATGRDRRNLIRQRDRSVTRYNLEQEQTETQRGRQQEMWEAEDERYEKQTEYQENLMRLEEENFEMTRNHQYASRALEVEDFERRKVEYQEERAIREEMEALQREHQALMMEFQEKSLGIQAAAIALQQQLAEDQELAANEVLDDVAEFMDIWTNDKAKAMWDLMGSVMQSAATANQDNVKEVKAMIDSLKNPSLVSGTDALIRLIREIRNFSIQIYGPLP